MREGKIVTAQSPSSPPNPAHRHVLTCTPPHSGPALDQLIHPLDRAYLTTGIDLSSSLLSPDPDSQNSLYTSRRILAFVRPRRPLASKHGAPGRLRPPLRLHGVLQPRHDGGGAASALPAAAAAPAAGQVLRYAEAAQDEAVHPRAVRVHASLLARPRRLRLSPSGYVWCSRAGLFFFSC